MMATKSDTNDQKEKQEESTFNFIMRRAAELYDPDSGLDLQLLC